MQTNKTSGLLNWDVLSRLMTNVEAALSFNNLNKIEWNNYDKNKKAEFFMRHVYHDGVDPRIKNQINTLVNEHIDRAKDEMFAVESLNPLNSTSFVEGEPEAAPKPKPEEAGHNLLRKVDIKLRNEAMVCVIKDLVDEIHFDEI